MNASARMAGDFIYELSLLCLDVFQNEFGKVDDLVHFVVRQIYYSCQITSESALLLLDQGREWDADVLNRSVAEGLVKLVFILKSPVNDQANLAEEFWITMPENAELRRSDRAKEILDAAAGRGKDSWKPIEELVLNDVQVNAILSKSNRAERKRLEQKWSFSEILKFFAASNDEKVRPLALLAYNYGMNSHLVHKDGDGVGMIWERATRDDERREAVVNGHIARGISDICSFALFRAYYVFMAGGRDFEVVKTLEKKYDELFKSLEMDGNEFIIFEYK